MSHGAEETLEGLRGDPQRPHVGACSPGARGLNLTWSARANWASGSKSGLHKQSLLISPRSSTPRVHLARFTATPTPVGSGSKVNCVL